MRKILIIAICTLVYSTIANAQFGKESLDEIKELKKSGKLNVILIKDNKKGKWAKTNQAIKETIEKYWNFTGYEIFSHEEYKMIKKDASTDNQFFMKIFMKDVGYGLIEFDLFIIKGDRWMVPSTRITAGLFVVNDFRGGEKFLSRFLPIHIRAMQNYLENSIKLGTADVQEINKTNHKLLKERKLCMFESNVTKDAQAEFPTLYKHEFEFVDYDTYLKMLDNMVDRNALFFKNYNPHNSQWYDLIIDMETGRILYWEKGGPLRMGTNGVEKLVKAAG